MEVAKRARLSHHPPDGPGLHNAKCKAHTVMATQKSEPEPCTTEREGGLLRLSYVMLYSLVV